MTALLEALGLPDRARYYTGRCGSCGRSWWLEGRGGRLSGRHGLRDVLEVVRAGVLVSHDCGGRSRAVVVPEVRGTVNPGVRCDARCQGATGPDCECSCGGRNHGRGA